MQDYVFSQYDQNSFKLIILASAVRNNYYRSPFKLFCFPIDIWIWFLITRASRLSVCQWRWHQILVLCLRIFSFSVDSLQSQFEWQGSLLNWSCDRVVGRLDRRACMSTGYARPGLQDMVRVQCNIQIYTSFSWAITKPDRPSRYWESPLGFCSLCLFLLHYKLVHSLF